MALSPSMLPMTYFLVFLSTLWQLVACNRWAGPGAQLFLRHVKDFYKFPQGCGRSGASTTQVNLDVKPDKQARKTFWKERGSIVNTARTTMWSWFRTMPETFITKSKTENLKTRRS